MKRFINKIFLGDSLNLLRRLPAESIDAVIADPMYMVARKKPKSCVYDWGPEPGTGTAEEYWAYHRPIYEECRRILKPGGALAWAMGCKFTQHFKEWFRGHRIWSFSRFFHHGLNAFGHIWMVQRAKEQTPIAFPDDDALLIIGKRPQITLLHPCAKTVEEMQFMVRHLTKPGQIVLDCFCGSGTTLVAAQTLDRLWIGCDLSKTYCQIAMSRLAELGMVFDPSSRLVAKEEAK
jgi:site-specific DNA-methyltransferase (adenine-specific)